MDSNKPLTRAAYLLAFLLVAIPLFDAMTSVWPLRIADERWRFGAVGALSNLTLVPLLGLLIALAAATFSDGRRTRRVLGWISAIFALALAVMAVLFILDYFQVRTIVTPKFQHATAVATTTALVKLALATIALILLSRAGFAGPKSLAKKKQVIVTDSRTTPLIPLTGNARGE